MKNTLPYICAAACLWLAACASTPKPAVQAPLKLETASDVKTLTCGSYGCEDRLRAECGGSDFKVLRQETSNKTSSRRNQTTGGWDNNRTESVNYIFRCLDTAAAKKAAEISPPPGIE